MRALPIVLPVLLALAAASAAPAASEKETLQRTLLVAEKARALSNLRAALGNETVTLTEGSFRRVAPDVWETSNVVLASDAELLTVDFSRETVLSNDKDAILSRKSEFTGLRIRPALLEKSMQASKKASRAATNENALGLEALSHVFRGALSGSWIQRYDAEKKTLSLENADLRSPDGFRVTLSALVADVEKRHLVDPTLFQGAIASGETPLRSFDLSFAVAETNLDLARLVTNLDPTNRQNAELVRAASFPATVSLRLGGTLSFRSATSNLTVTGLVLQVDPLFRVSLDLQASRIALPKPAPAGETNANASRRIDPAKELTRTAQIGALRLEIVDLGLRPLVYEIFARQNGSSPEASGAALAALMNIALAQKNQNGELDALLKPITVFLTQPKKNSLRLTLRKGATLSGRDLRSGPAGLLQKFELE